MTRLSLFGKRPCFGGIFCPKIEDIHRFQVYRQQSLHLQVRWCDQLCSHSGLGKDPSRHGSCKEPCHGHMKEAEKWHCLNKLFFCSLEEFVFFGSTWKTHYLKLHHIYLALSYGICEQHSNSQQSTRYTIYLPSQQLARPSHWLIVFCHIHKKTEPLPNGVGRGRVTKWRGKARYFEWWSVVVV